MAERCGVRYADRICYIYMHMERDAESSPPAFCYYSGKLNEGMVDGDRVAFSIKIYTEGTPVLYQLQKGKPEGKKDGRPSIRRETHTPQVVTGRSRDRC